jgi:hypothetical protein
VRYVAVAILSITATLAIVSVGIAQSGQDQAPSGAKTSAKGAPAKTPATARNTVTNDSQPRDTDHTITFEEYKAIPYRACINARGWKNGRLVCADDGDNTQFQNGREMGGPLSPQ